jgi:hypothetical protein
VATLTNTGDGVLVLNPTIIGNGSFTVAAGGCGYTLAPAASCAVMVQFLPIGMREEQHSETLNLGITSLPAGMNQNIALSGVGITLPPGAVAPTANTQVAQYTLTLPEAGTWSVNFGTTEIYGLSTGVQSATANTPSSLYVAGMLPNTLYHMQAVVTLPNGVTAAEPDLTFITGALPRDSAHPARDPYARDDAAARRGIGQPDHRRDPVDRLRNRSAGQRHLGVSVPRLAVAGYVVPGPPAPERSLPVLDSPKFVSDYGPSGNSDRDSRV